MIIDTSYFANRPLFIPGSVEQPSIGLNTPSLKSGLQNYIDEKEKCLLLSFLGYEQTTDLLSQLNADGTFIDNALQKWKDLVDGKENWRGLRYKVLNSNISLIAYYIYFHFVGQDAKYVSNVGVQSPKAANSVTVISNDKQTFAWSEFLKMYGYNGNSGLNYSFFHNWNGTGMQWGSGNTNANETTLYEFITANSDIYDPSKFTHYKPVNSMGL